LRRAALTKLPLLFLALLLFGSATAQGFTIVRTSSPKFYTDIPNGLKGMYVSYQITNTSGSSYTDVWVGADTFTGGSVSLANGEDGLVQLGAMAPGQMKTAYFYLQANSTSLSAQSHTVRVYNGKPPTGTQVDSATFSFTAVEDTIQANANKITTTVSGPNPPGLGGIMTVQVTGHSGTIGDQNLLSFTPASELDWIADNFQLVSTTVVLTGGNTGTYTDRLLISGLASPSDTDYTVTYSFRATGVATVSQRITPMVFIASGTQIKHTQGDPQTISSAINSLTMTKLVSSSQVYVGGSVTYTLRVSNVGGAYDATVDDLVDTLPTSPASATYVTNSSTFNGAAIGNPTISGSTLTWVGTFTVPAGTTRDLTFQATFPNTAGTYTNRAVGHIGNTQIDTTASTTDNSPASVNTNVVGYPDLTVSKSHTGNFTQGQNGATYTITVTNSGGSSTTSSVTVTDTLPASLTYVPTTISGWSCSAAGQVITCTSSNVVAAGATFPALTLTVNVSATAPASVTNNVSVSGGGETNTGNNSASDATTINQVADMTVAKTHTGNFTRGSTGSYLITATNNGTGAVPAGTTVTVSDTLPAGLTPTGWTIPPGSGWSCNIASQTVTCTNSNALAVGASYAAISITVSVAQNAAASLTNTATVSGGGQVVTSNDSSSDPTTIVSSSDLSLTKVTSNPGLGIGTNATFTITVSNAGPTNATGVAVRDQLPAGLTYVSSTPSVGSYNSGTGVWTVGNLASGTSATLTLVARVDALGAITNTAQVSAANEPDPDSTPNNSVASEDDQASSSLSTSPPSVSLCKTILGQPCPPPALTGLPGTDLAYVITFNNTGGSSAASFVITDPIPSNTDFKVGSVTSSLGTTGLSLTLVTPNDRITYSNNGGATWVYTPVSGGGGAPAGYDRNVTHIRWSFIGSLSQTAPNNTGNVGFTVRIR
jgi:uncharacterized repeat protein (TIGR01451 family)